MLRSHLKRLTGISLISGIGISLGQSRDEKPHIVVVGGGITGSWTTLLLTKLARLGLVRVTHVDSGHSVRGSWGDTRALHLTMEDDIRIKMNMVNVNDYLNLQSEAGSSTLLIKKVGRVFSGPTESMAKMHNLMSANGVNVSHVDRQWLDDPRNTEQVNSLQGIQIRSSDTGWAGWSTVYTPVGYILKADNILSHMRNLISEASTSCSNVTLLENSTVTHIDRSNKVLKIDDAFSSYGTSRVIPYDKLILTTGPWTNSLLGPETMTPSLPLLPIVVSNEQTQDFITSNGMYSSMPLLTYSDGGYVKSGGDYWFIVGPCPDSEGENVERRVKVGFHRQGDIMDNSEFKLPELNEEKKEKLIQNMSHVRKDIKVGEEAQSFETDDFILSKAKSLVRERLSGLEPDSVSLIMRCLYQNTPDKEFIIGHHPEDTDQDIVIACGFNGGGFQMGPMVARLVIGHCLANQVSASQIAGLLPPCKVVKNKDFNVSSIDLGDLLESMAKKFDPKRESLKEFF